MNREIRAKIMREFAAKRTRALQSAADRKAKLYMEHPELRSLDAETAALSRDYMRRKLEGVGTAEEYAERLAQIDARREEIIAAAGIDLSAHFECEICQDTGRLQGEYCRCFLSRVIEENLANANLSATSAHERFETFDLGFYGTEPHPIYGRSPREHMKRVLERCKRFVMQFDETKNLLLVGAPGLGKTFLSSAIANELLSQGKTVIYLSANEFFARAQANKFSDQMLEEMAPYYEADLLILDDLGTEFRTQLTMSVLSEVVDRRLRSGKKMIFSTNLTLKELENTYTARIISRLMGCFDYVQFIGDDIRLKKKGN